MTSLAGMALLGSGSTPTRGQRWRAVRRAAAFVIGEADGATGRLVSGGAEGRPMYGHGFGTMFLASVYGMEEGRRQKALVKSALDGAVKLIAASQNRAGGWWYQHDDGRDEGSVTITQIQALRACRMAGIVVDKRVIDRAVSYMKRCQNPDGGIRYQLESAGTASLPAITAAGVAVFYNAGVYDDQAFVDAAVGFCKSQLKVELDTTGHHFYAHLYWSQALYQRGGPDWDDYYARACTWLKKRQRKDGSWQGGGVGPVYGTSVALTILQLPDSLVPIYQR
ncbi:MAG: prenyltransferase/squalene oxidase repeat-containing protein [Planctomycetota bacterium]